MLLAQVLDQGLSLADTVGDAEPGDPRDRAFSRHLAYGVLRWLGALQWLSAQLLQRPLRQRDHDIQRLIFIGLHELWQSETGAHAAINEAAECARILDKPWAVGLINAVLRRFQRDRGPWLDRLAERDERFAHPAWLLDALRRDWPDDWQSIVAANNQPAPLWLRVRCDCDSRGLLEQFVHSGIVTRDQQDSARVDVSSIQQALQRSIGDGNRVRLIGQLESDAAKLRGRTPYLGSGIVVLSTSFEKSCLTLSMGDRRRFVG